METSDKQLKPQTDAFPWLPVSADRIKNTRKMHNSKLYLSLLHQVETSQAAELNRLTGGIVWKVLSYIGLLPRRRDKRYGYFIKEEVA